MVMGPGRKWRDRRGQHRRSAHAVSRLFDRALEFAIQSRKCALERAADSALEQQSVEETRDPAARFVLDDESVHEAVAVGPKWRSCCASGRPGCVLV